MVIANGNVFEDAEATGPVIGYVDLTATTTAINPPDNITERRQLFIEVAFNDGVAPDLYAPVAELEASLPGGNAVDSTAAAFERALASGDALEMSGVETYPTGGGISRKKPLVLAVSTKRKERERRERERREGGRGNSGSENRHCKSSFFFFSLPRRLSPALCSHFFSISSFAPRPSLDFDLEKTKNSNRKGHGRDGRARRRERPGARRGRRRREGLQVHFYAALRTLW